LLIQIASGIVQIEVKMKIKSLKSNFSIRSIVLIALSFSVVTVAKETQINPEWRARMQEMLTDVVDLFPFAFDESKFNDPKNSSKIKSSLAALAKHSSGLKNHTAKASGAVGLKMDPALPFVAQAFESEINSANAAFLAGRSSYPQSQEFLRAGLAKCMVCHSQSTIGPELKIENFKSQLAELPSKDRFMALAVTRQFDEALSEFSKFFHSTKLKKSGSFAFDKEVKAAFSIAVRVKQDPKRTLALIEEISGSDQISTMLKNDLKDWRADTLTWQSEKPTELQTDQSLFKEAKRLIENTSMKNSSLDHIKNSSIPLLRASSHLHDLLANHPKSSLRASSYLLLAETYDSLPGFAIWDMAEEYLGACILENPHSTVAEKCFEKYQTSMVLGYSGSSGIHMPASIKQHLQYLKNLALPKTKTKVEKSKK
jgi:hypothetical protein